MPDEKQELINALVEFVVTLIYSEAIDHVRDEFFPDTAGTDGIRYEHREPVLSYAKDSLTILCEMHAPDLKEEIRTKILTKVAESFDTLYEETK